jgi:outer membrane biosynthesis protein TonB
LQLQHQKTVNQLKVNNMKKVILSIALTGALFTVASAQDQQSNQQPVRAAGAPAAAQATTQPQAKEAQPAGQASNQAPATPAQPATSTPAQPTAGAASDNSAK